MAIANVQSHIVQPNIQASTHTHTLAPSLNLIAYTQNHQTNKIGKALETKAIQTETNGFVFEIQKLI